MGSEVMPEVTRNSLLPRQRRHVIARQRMGMLVDVVNHAESRRRQSSGGD